MPAAVIHASVRVLKLQLNRSCPGCLACLLCCCLLLSQQVINTPLHYARRIRCENPALQVSSGSGETDTQLVGKACCVTTAAVDALRLQLLDAATGNSVADATLHLPLLSSSVHKQAVRLYASGECIGKLQVELHLSIEDATAQLLAPAPGMLAGFAFEKPWMENVDLHRLRETKIQQIRASHNTDALLDFEQEAAYGRFPQDEDTDSRFVKAFELAQLCVQYLSACNSTLQQRMALLNSALDGLDNCEEAVDARLRKHKTAAKELLNRRKLQEELIEQHLGLLQIYDPETGDRVSIDKSWKLQYSCRPQQDQFSMAVDKRERAAQKLSRDDLAHSSTESKSTSTHRARQPIPAESKEAASSKERPNGGIHMAKFKGDGTKSIEEAEDAALGIYSSAVAKDDDKLDTREFTVDSLEAFGIGQPPREDDVSVEWRRQPGHTQPRYLQNTFGSTLSVDSLQLPATQRNDGPHGGEQEEMVTQDSIECKSYQDSTRLDSLSTFPAAVVATARKKSMTASTNGAHGLDVTHETQYEDDFEAESIAFSHASLHADASTNARVEADDFVLLGTLRQSPELAAQDDVAVREQQLCPKQSPPGDSGGESTMDDDVEDLSLSEIAVPEFITRKQNRRAGVQQLASSKFAEPTKPLPIVSSVSPPPHTALKEFSEEDVYDFDQESVEKALNARAHDPLPDNELELAEWQLGRAKLDDLEQGIAIEVAVLSIQGVENNSRSERDVRCRVGLLDVISPNSGLVSLEAGNCELSPINFFTHLKITRANCRKIQREMQRQGDDFGVAVQIVDDESNEVLAEATLPLAAMAELSAHLLQKEAQLTASTINAEDLQFTQAAVTVDVRGYRALQRCLSMNK